MSNMVVNTNILALNSHRAMKNVGETQSKSSARLSSGLRVNSAADDAAGLAISEKMRSQIRGLDMASKNAQDATSLIQTAEGGMQEVDNMLQRIRELVVQVSNDTNENNTTGTGDRQKVQDEINQLVEEIDSMGERVEYNKKKLINGTYADPVEMLATASSKYTQAAADLESATIKLQISRTDQVNANEDYDTLNKIVGAFEFEQNKRNTELSTALDSLKEYAATFSIGATTTYNAQAYDAAMKGFVKELASTDPSKWTDTFMQQLAEKYFADDGTGSKAGFRVASGTETFSPDQTSVGIEGSIRSGGGFTLTLVGSFVSGAGTTGAVFAAITMSLIDGDLMGLITAAYEAYSNVMVWDTNGNASISTAYPMATASAAFAGTSITTATGGNITLPSERTEYKSKVNQISENTKFNSSADMYKALANVSGTKADADLSVSSLETEVKTLSAMIETYNIQIKSANSLIGDLNGVQPGLYFQVGSNAHQSLQTSIGSVKSDILGVGDGNGKSKINVLEDTGFDITSTLNVLDEALSYVTTQRSKLGAAQNRLEYTVSSLDVSSENLSAAESRIRDADMAQEMMNVTKANVLQQAAVSMLAQANQAPQTVLQLLR